MRARTALILCLSLSGQTLARGGERQDTFPFSGPDIIHRYAGETAPFDGVLLSDALAKQQAQRIVDAERERDAKFTFRTVLLAAGVALLIGTAVGISVDRLVRK